jgi:hypothetical protein
MPLDEYISVPLEEGIIVARQGSCRLFMIAGSARFVWERRADGLPDADIPPLLTRRYGISLAQAEQDVRDVLRLWDSEGLIVTRGRRREYKIANLRFSIRYKDKDLEAAVAPVLEHLAQDSTSSSNEYQPEFDVGITRREFILRIDYVETLHSLVLDEIIERLLTSIVQFAYDKLDWLFSMHASAVATGNACVMIPGPSGSGKSTLAAALVSQGYDYLTDDLVMLDRANMRAVPLSVPLVLKAGSWESLEPYIPELSSAPLCRRFGQNVRYWTPGKTQITRTWLPIRAMIFPNYQRQATVEIVKLPAFEALSRIAAASCVINPPTTSEAVMRLASWVGSFPAYALTYGSLSAGTTAIREQLDS